MALSFFFPFPMLCMSVSVCVSVYGSVRIYVYVCVYVCMSVCVCLCVFMSGFVGCLCLGTSEELPLWGSTD